MIDGSDCVSLASSIVSGRRKNGRVRGYRSVASQESCVKQSSPATKTAAALLYARECVRWNCEFARCGGQDAGSMLRFVSAGESHGQALIAWISGLPLGVP